MNAMPVIEVRKIATAETYPVRHVVLRPGRPLESCYYPRDDDKGTFHLGAFVDQRLAGVATYLRDDHPELPGRQTYRLRGMAVLDEYQGLGLGRALIEAFYPRLAALDCTLLWFTAREAAVGFYEKQGFTRFGEYYEEPLLGPHLVMYKRLGH
jgi:[ribosomal protein S5]-alanine N-acetyltransferase